MATRTQRRLRRALKDAERISRAALGRATTRTPTSRGVEPRWTYGPYDPPSSEDFPPRGDDLDGGAGVREPRRPAPVTPVDAIALPEPEPVMLDLVPDEDQRASLTVDSSWVPSSQGQRSGKSISSHS